MKQLLPFIFLNILVFCIRPCFAQSLEFVENKGQWDSKVKYSGKIANGSFYLQQQGYKVLLNNSDDLKAVAELFGGHKTIQLDSTKPGPFIDPNKEFPKIDTFRQVVLHAHAYEVNFIGSSNKAEIIPDKMMNTYSNYFTGSDPAKWKTDCKIFQAVTYKNIYPNIDARYYEDNGKLKYEFIIRPGGDIRKIALAFSGVDGLKISKGNLIIQTSVGEASELKPISWQIGMKGKKEISSSFILDGNTVRFKVDNYEKTETLIIDPTLIFASFTNSISDNWGYTATFDGSGNFYAGGIVFSDGYPVSTGAIQTVFGGGTQQGGLPGFDIGIIKLSSNGSSRLYATYLGGNGNEQPHSMVVDHAGNLVVAGRTTSLNFPTTSALYGSGGGFDIFLTKISADGKSLLASRKFGGSANDGVNIVDKEMSGGALSISRNYGDDARSEVIVDAANNILLGSCTQSSNFPTTANAFQQNFGGSQDGVVLKVSPDMTNVLFSSFFGGSGDEAAFVISLNPINGNIYIGGATTSSNLKGIGSNNGPLIFNSFQGGICDGYAAIISPDGGTLIRSVYVGSGGNDLVYGLKFDKGGFPYINGNTTGTLPVVNSAFQSQKNGKQYITKLKPDLSGIIYSTNFGKGQSTPDISPDAFLVDRCENVYVSGWGGGLDIVGNYPNANTFGLITTPNAIRQTSDGSDFYFFVLEKDAKSQLYGTFFGNLDNGPSVGDHVDGGTSRFDESGVIYQAICANCAKTGIFPTTPGVWGPNNGAQNGSLCNEAAVKIAFELAGVGSAVQSSINGIPNDTTGCVPLTVNFRDTIGNAVKYIWDFGDGTSNVSTTTPNVSHTYNTIGYFLVMLVAIDSSTCNIADTSYTHIRVKDNEAKLDFDYLKLPPCDSLKFQFNNLSIAPPGFPFTTQSFEWDFGDGTKIITDTTNIIHQFPSIGTYTIRMTLLDTGYCNSNDYVEKIINITDLVKANFVQPPFACVNQPLTFINTSIGGETYLWDFGDGTTSTEESPIHIYPTQGKYRVVLTATNLNSCNLVDSLVYDIYVYDAPISSFTFSPVVPPENAPVTFINTSVGGVFYKWIFGDGDSILTSKRDTLISHYYNRSGVNTTCLIVYNLAGCTDTTCVDILATVVPLLDVPNAFTPNGDGVNDLVKVRGFGIAKMDWKIYNRWGQMVFQTVSISEGWDGKYKGVLQPQEVYVYVLDVTFTDGTSFRKKGDITLLR